MDKNAKIDTVKTDDFTMSFFKFGHGEKTLVILPGLSVQSVMGSAEAIEEAYKALTDAFTIYVFDRREELPASYSIYDMAQDTAEAFQALNLQHVSLFGASQGGMIAMEIAVNHPELVEKMVLGSTSAQISDERFQVVEEWIRLAEDSDAEDLYQAFGEAVYPKDVYEQIRELLADAANTVSLEELERFTVLAKAMKGFDIRRDLEKITCPVLVIGDSEDGVLGVEAVETIAKYLGDKPGFEVFMYHGYGHAAYDTAPDYKERILHFLVPES